MTGLLVTAACGGSGPAQPHEPSLRVELTSVSTNLRYEERAVVTMSLSDPARPLSANDFDARGLEVLDMVAETARLYRIAVRVTAASGQASITVPAGRMTTAAGLSNALPASWSIAVDPRPPIAFDAAFQPLRYAPELRYSYYSPGAETVNVFYSDAEPIRVRTAGPEFPRGFLVMVQFQKSLVSFDPHGRVRWAFPSAGRFVTASGDDILVSDALDLRLVHVLDPAGTPVSTLAFDREVNYAKLIAGRLLVVYNDDGPAEVFEWLDGRRLGDRTFRSVPLNYARAADLSGDRLALADTYGGRIVVQSLLSGAVVHEHAVSYPNDVAWRGEFLYVAEEHVDRIVAFNLADGSKHVVLAPPSAPRWEISSSMDSLPREYCGGDVAFPRSIASDACSGERTLYAPDGLHLAERGLWVADTDNARVLHLSDDGRLSVLTGLNGPVKIVPFH